VFIRLQIPALHVKLQGKLNMYNQLHVIFVYKEHRISLDISFDAVVGCDLAVDRQSLQPRDVTCQSKKYLTA
jgi:hypothetical protein